MTHILDSQTGQFVSQDHARVAALIHNYSHELALVFIPPEQRQLDEQFPFAILHSPANKPPYIVRKVRTEDLNEGLIAWLYHSDNVGDLNAWLDGKELAQRMNDDAIAAEKRAEYADFAKSVLDGKNWYRHNGKVYS